MSQRDVCLQQLYLYGKRTRQVRTSEAHFRKDTLSQIYDSYQHSIHLCHYNQDSSYCQSIAQHYNLQIESKFNNHVNQRTLKLEGPHRSFQLHHFADVKTVQRHDDSSTTTDPFSKEVLESGCWTYSLYTSTHTCPQDLIGVSPTQERSTDQQLHIQQACS